MMPSNMPQHDDEAQDADLIKQVLQKIITEMDGLEAKRIHPGMPAAPADAATPQDGSQPDDSEMPPTPMFDGGQLGQKDPNGNHAETPEAAEPENQFNQHEGLDPDVLKKLMDRAGMADETGAESEDEFLGMPPAIADAVRKKRQPLPKK